MPGARCAGGTRALYDDRLAILSQSRVMVDWRGRLRSVSSALVRFHVDAIFPAVAFDIGLQQNLSRSSLSARLGAHEHRHGVVNNLVHLGLHFVLTHRAFFDGDGCVERLNCQILEISLSWRCVVTGDDGAQEATGKGYSTALANLSPPMKRSPSDGTPR